MPVEIGAQIIDPRTSAKIWQLTHASLRFTASVDPDADLAEQLKQLKRELKDWEHAFADREGRKPEKADITADKEIGESCGKLGDVGVGPGP